MTTATAKRDYYEVLGLARDADAAAIKDAFRRLAMQYHPDRNKAPGAEEKFKEIAEAYAVLSDPTKRAEYDSGGFAGIAGFTPEDLFGGVDVGDLFADFGLGFGPSIFDRFFHGRRAGPQQGADIDVKVVVPLARIATGGEETVRFLRLEVCRDCGGSGARAGTQPRACAACKGTGQKTTSRREQGVLIRQSTLCPDCGGRGHFIDTPCPTCAGTGQTRGQASIVVKIPAGAEDGMILRVAGCGHPSEVRGGAPGDLNVIVRTAPDPRFRRDGADLWCAHALDVADAVLGAEIRVPTLDGSVALTVPPGTQPDEQFRLRGKGLPRFGARGRGDLYVQVNVRIPEHPDAEERKLWERLRALRAKR